MLCCRRYFKTVEEGSGNGYIWHTTGSGKTLTSFKASQILTQRSDIKKVVFVVDKFGHPDCTRVNNFSDDSFEDTDKTATLVKQLKDDSVPLIVTTIQKLVSYFLSGREIRHLKDERMVFIFDECHRSQFEQRTRELPISLPIHSYSVLLVPNLCRELSANEHGKNHNDLFDKCLHKYLIVDAIEDEMYYPSRLIT